MKLSLFWKLMAAFALVVVVSVGGVIFIVGQTTRDAFRQYMVGAGIVPDQLLAQLADYYARTASWNGVSALIGVTDAHSSGGRGMGGMGGRVIVADTQGNIVADSNGTTGGQLSSGQLARGVPITVKGQRVGTLFVGGALGSGMMMGGQFSTMMGAAEQGFLDRVNRAVWLAGLAGAVAALLLGFIVFRGVTSPLGRLTRAAHAVSAGDLSQRVQIHTGDEIAELGAAFNSMAANLERGEQLRRQMTADIAHELRTPLSVIQGNLEAILDGVYTPDAEHIQPALDQAQLLTRLVEDLRTLALAEAGQLSLNAQPTEAKELARRVVASFEAQANAKHVMLKLKAPASPLYVRADGQRIAQVLTNLLGNALRYTPEGGQVQVHLQAQDHAMQRRAVVLSVHDTGQGIAPEDLPHVFDRFYRADKSRARESRDPQGASGSGLGLAIARSIVEAHGGSIWAKSQPGQGTTVAFTLPASD
jgi:signal transduction histidine kinase